MAVITDSGDFGLQDEFGRPITDEVDLPRPDAADYAEVLLALLPSGRVWPRNPDSILARVAGALAPTFSRLSARARYLLRDSPAGDSLVEQLPEWEETLGLPDACSGPEPTVALRQQAVRAKLSARGGQSAPYFVGVAGKLGVPITITEYVPLRFSRLRFAGLKFNGPAMAHTWRVNAPASQLVPFRFGPGRFGDPFGTFGSTLLTCMLNRIKPAHTLLQITYS